MARPVKEFDRKQFENMCAYQCTKKEICAFLNANPNTLSAWCKRTYGMQFRDVYEQKREAGKMSLRRKQWKLADKSAAMAIFLGKNYLGQRDSFDVADTTPIEKLDAILNGFRRKAEAQTQTGQAENGD